MQKLGTIKPGTIFVANWGYSMTLASFYEVVGITKTGKSVRVRELEKRVVQNETRESCGSIKVEPIPGEYCSGVITKRLRTEDYHTGSTAMHPLASERYAPLTWFNPGDSRHSAHVWDGTPQTENHYD